MKIVRSDSAIMYIDQDSVLARFEKYERVLQTMVNAHVKRKVTSAESAANN